MSRFGHISFLGLYFTIKESQSADQISYKCKKKKEEEKGIQLMTCILFKDVSSFVNWHIRQISPSPFFTKFTNET